MEEVRDFWNDIEESFLLELEQRDPKLPVLVEYNELEKPQTNFYLLKDTVKNIVAEIYQFIGKAVGNNFFNIINENNGHFRVGTAGWVFMRTNDRGCGRKICKACS
jgi:tetrahydromethanopterin S-methyltransferase subunit G